MKLSARKIFFKKKLLLLVLFLIVLDLLLLAVLLGIGRAPAKGNKPVNYPEIQLLAGKNMNFKELSDYFTLLAKEKGAKYAFEVLKKAPISPNIDMHLMGHIVGDILYKQEGAEGIKICTEDFRNACSHSIVVGLFSDEGEAALPKITKACEKAPGGRGAYNMCFHGLGHGILAAVGYNMEKAATICQKIGKVGPEGREAVECIGGTVMEIIGGGGHDREIWSVQRQKYLKADDPLYPCDSTFIPLEAQSQCYTYLTPHLFELAGADLASPTAKNFEDAFPYCEKIPQTDATNRYACFGGFGKEFVVLAKARDIRNIGNMTDAEVAKVYEWCSLAHNKEAEKACVLVALASIYWGGENNPAVAVRFCKAVSDLTIQDSCFTDLISAVRYYVSDLNYRKQFCSELPKSYQEKCGLS